MSTTCRKLAGGQATFRGMECHTESASRVNTHKGLHSTYKIKPGSSQECIQCHSDYNGEDLPLIKWEIKTSITNRPATFWMASTRAWPAGAGNGNGASRACLTPYPSEPFDLTAVLEKAEKELIVRTLTSTGGAQAEAARRTGLSRSALAYKLTRYGIRSTE